MDQFIKTKSKSVPNKKMRIFVKKSKPVPNKKGRTFVKMSGTFRLGNLICCGHVDWIMISEIVVLMLCWFTFTLLRYVYTA